MVVRDAKRAAILFFDLYASFFASGEGGVGLVGPVGCGITKKYYCPLNRKVVSPTP